MFQIPVIPITSLALLLATLGAASAEELRMNQVQVLGTHNSYHIAPDPAVIKTAMAFDKGAAGWDYTHPPINEQLDAGLRSFEIDLNLMDGKIHVFHVPLLDQKSTCPLFTDCLSNVLAWSQANPGHLPISLLLEIKEDYALWNKSVGAWTASDLAQLDAEVRQVIPEDKLITPDLVRGTHPTLEAAVLAGNWPKLSEARGKIFLAIHEQGRLRDLYLENSPTLEGRPCFIRSEPGAPYSAFIVADGPNDPKIPGWVRAGYYIRTRADSGAAKGIDARAQAAFDCGAQIVSTDYPIGHPHVKPEQQIGFDGKGYRCNPVNSPGDCPVLEQDRAAAAP